MARTNRIQPSQYAAIPTQEPVDWTYRWFPEGLLVPILLIAFVGIATFSVQYAGWTSLVIPLGVTGVAACVFGMLVAKASISEMFAHMGSFLGGVLFTFGMLVLAADSLGEGWRERLQPLGMILVDWYLGRRSTTDFHDLLISMLMGLIIWLIGYLSAWTLIRRGWLMASLFLPGLLFLVNLGYAPETHPSLLAIMVAIAIPLGARFYLYQRQQMWTRNGMRSPLHLTTRMVVITTVIGLLITTASWNAPASWSQASFQPLMKEVSNQFTATQKRAERWLDQNGNGRKDVGNTGSYTAFDDAFSVGGPLNLTDQEEVLVTTDLEQAPYLTAHHYDLYTGRGWASGVHEKFQRSGPDGQRFSPELLFHPEQSVALSEEITEDRVPMSMHVTPLVNSSGVLLTPDTYESASIPAVVRMSWEQLDNKPFALSAEVLTTLPPDIQRISSHLLRADLSGREGEGGTQAVDPDAQARIEDEVEVLRKRAITVRWETDGAGNVTMLYVSGQLPVYDDVEAIFPRNEQDASAGDSYSVTGLSSVAMARDLESAGTEYPDWVEDRYLQLGESVTPETIDLALTITESAATPYEQAELVRDWLRANIVYDERVAAPPEGEDVVDYVLFDNRRGYCEHYSSAMTVMMRALGVPARTVVGYYPGEFDAGRDGYLYRQLNAHAWTEVFFPGYGWIPFEPTANRPVSDFEQTGETEQAVPEPTAQVEEPTVVPQATPPASTAVVDRPAFESPGPQMIVRDEEGGIPGWVVPAVVGGASLVVVGGGLWFAWNWRLRGLAPSAALYRKLVRVGRIGGVKATSSTTPREYANTFNRSLPAAGPAARRIVQVYEMDEFGLEEAGEGRLAEARSAWRRVRSVIPRILLRRRS